MRLIFLILLLIVSLVGCDRRLNREITREDALKIAHSAAKKHGYDIDEYMLSDFAEELSQDKKKWMFLFLKKPVPALGNQFVVVVDRSTGVTHVIPGE
ncbi:MAG: hypothetical protein HOP03_00030 [Lysobacter sp.]|nr:hypothetical protein [Lysobacter sp.]